MTFSAFTVLCSHHHCLVPEGFLTPKRKSCAHSAVTLHSPPPSPSLWLPPICFLSLWIYLFWACHVNRIIRYVTFCVGLLPLGIVFSKFTHLAVSVGTSFYGWIICFVEIDHLLFIHSSADGNLGCFHLLVIVNCAAVNICVSFCLNTYFQFFLDVYLGVELMGHMVILCLTSWGTVKPFFTVTSHQLSNMLMSIQLKKHLNPMSLFSYWSFSRLLSEQLLGKSVYRLTLFP